MDFSVAELSAYLDMSVEEIEDILRISRRRAVTKGWYLHRNCVNLAIKQKQKEKNTMVHHMLCGNSNGSRGCKETGAEKKRIGRET